MLLMPFQFTMVGVTIPLPDWVKATIGLALPMMANIAEIVRGAVSSIPTAQWESAEILAFTRRQTLWRIILPQCVKRMLPPWMNLYAILTRRRPCWSSIVGVYGGDDADRATRSPPRTGADLLMPIYGFCCCGSSSTAIRSRAGPSGWSASMPSRLT